MKTKQRFLSTLLMAIVMMAMSPQCIWAVKTAKVIFNGTETLTFYYDETDHSSEGRIFSLNETTAPTWYISSVYPYVTTVVFDDSFAEARPKSCVYWFNDFANLTTITGLRNLNTSEVTNMNYMFFNCKKLKTLNLSSFDTSEVTSMKRMFYKCTLLETLTLGSNFNTKKVTDMNGMFNSCSALKTLDLSSFNTSEVTTMERMFQECTALETLILSSNFNTKKVKTMEKMFFNCINLKTLDLSSFNTAEVTTMNQMFFTCSELTSLNLSAFNTEKVTNMYCMFDQCSALETLTLGSNFKTELVTNMKYMFFNCKNLKTLDLSTFNTAEATEMSFMFSNCTSLKTLTIGNFDMQKVTEKSGMFGNCTSLKTLTLKALPYLINVTFDYVNWTTVNYDLQLDDNSIVYTGTNYLPAATAWTAVPTFTRTIAAASNWGTLVVPFEAKSDENVQLYELKSVADNKMTFSPVETVAANTPCVFKKKTAGATSVTFTATSNAASATVPATPAAVEGYAIRGTYTQTSIGGTEGNGVYFIANNEFWRADAKTTVKPFRAWFEFSSGSDAKSFDIVVEENGETTSIGEISNGTLNMVNGTYYNLNGQRLSAPQKGQINIINGRKVFVK